MSAGVSPRQFAAGTASGLLACLLTLAVAPSARADVGSDPLAWLTRARSAARSLNYSGVFVHNQPNQQVSARITHVMEGGQELEKLEPLDGPLREFIRRGDETICYMPDQRAIKLDRRVTGRFFPQLINSEAETIARNYNVMLGLVERVGGFECRWIHLQPKDQLRYAQRLCSEVNTGLLLRAKLMSERDDTIEQFSFTELKVGARVGREVLKSRFEKEPPRRYRGDGVPPPIEPQSVATGWFLSPVPAGFTKVAELRRAMPGRPQPVSHLVFSDGLASVSVFVEPLPEGKSVSEASSLAGCSSVHVLSQGNNMVTVLGEVPLGTAQLVGRSVSYRAP